MAEPRSTAKYNIRFPASDAGWAVPSPLADYEAESDAVGAPASMLAVHVYVSVKPGSEEAFLEASLANAAASVSEPGIARFDVIQQADDPTKFVLMEVYW